jgi:TolB protein
MIKDKKVAMRGNIQRGWAYAVADSIYETLTNEPGFFQTKIAYAKEVPLKNGSHYKYIYIADYDGSHEELIVKTPTVNVSPRWNNDQNRPLLFYSENTNSNMRMMAADMHKKRIVASNFDGLNMLPAFSPDGTSVVFCATRGSKHCQLYHWSNKQLKTLTHNTGNNFAPVFSADGKTIYFSSDFEAGQPQIYSYALDTQQLTRITRDGYCVSPTYNAHRNQLAYAKMVHGVMQLWVYDFKKNIHMQLTYDKAQKEECTWSACGTYLLCPVEDSKSTRIALYNTITEEYRYLTSEKENCSYPAWSTIYNEYPVIA